MRVSLRGLYPRYTLLSLLLSHLPLTESSANDLLWPNASVRRNTKQMTPFGLFREGCGRSTVMNLPSRKAGLTHDTPAQWQELESWIGQERRYGAKLVHKPEEALMLHTVSPLILKLSLFLMTAVATHLVMSFGQTLLHYKVAHHPIGGKLFRNHINFHHTHYADDHLVSRTYLGDEGNITPYFLIPVFLVGGPLISYCR